MPNPAPIEKSAWIHIVDRKILCTLSKGKDTYYLPGGKREPGESESEALIREIKEELSVDLIPETVQPLGEFSAQAHGKPEGTLVHMSCFTADYRGELKPASEIATMVWFTYRDKEKCSQVDKLIFNWLYERGLLGE
jgi:8-oxo-dGTP pyrophosphatase MutT (NUDIX family)